MIKKLSKHSNSLALVLERSVFELLKIDANTTLEISTDSQVLIISPKRDEDNHKKFKDALKKTNRKYERMLRRLAD